MKEGSLKAHKAELDRVARELEEEERLKAEKADKRARSGKKVRARQYLDAYVVHMKRN